MKYKRFRDIPRFTSDATYSVHVGWRYLDSLLEELERGCKLQIDPDFQRAHVWTEAQQIAFVEFKLRGGMGSDEIRWNHPHWQHGPLDEGELVLVDGKQRLQAVRRFMRNEIPAFGGFLRDYEDKPEILRSRFEFKINTLPTRADVLRWYLEINTGGVVHSDEEIDRVRGLLDAETAHSEKAG